MPVTPRPRFIPRLGISMPYLDNVFTYHVDADDRIEAVDDPWLRFAIDNGAPELSREHVVGRILWSFLAGAETEHLYRVIFESVRKNRRTTRVPFRCDSPTRVRKMTISVEPTAADGLVLTSVLLEQSARPYRGMIGAMTGAIPGGAASDCAGPRALESDELLSVCGWCKRIESERDGWLEVEQAIRRLRLFDALPLPRLTHGLCDRCDVGLSESV